MVKDYLVSNGFVETFKEVFCEPSSSETIRNYCSNDPTSKTNETCAQVFEEYKPELFNIESRKHIESLIESGQIDACTSLISKDYPSLWKSNKSIECSLLSIKFINHFKQNQIQEAIELLSQEPLLQLDHYNPDNSEIITVNQEG